MKKLLFIVNVDWFFISHRLPIALKAKSQGFEIHIAASITNNLELLENHGFIVHPLNLHRSSVLGLLTEFIEIVLILKKVSPNILHLVTIKPVLLGGIASAIVKVPGILSALSGLGFIFVNEGFIASIRQKIILLLYRVALSHKNQKIIFQNSNDQSRLISLNPSIEKKSVLIPGSGVNLKKYKMKPFPNGTPVVILASRLLADKGVREFIQASSIVNSTRIRAKFVLAGDVDPLNPSSILTSELNEWRKKGEVQILGFRSDIVKLFESATIVILPSYYGEGLPKVLIEAGACGRPIITTDHPGCRDAIEDGVTGILVPIRNSKSIAEAVIELLDNPARCKKMGLNGRRRAEKMFDEQQVVAAHIQLYDELLSNTKSKYIRSNL